MFKNVNEKDKFANSWLILSSSIFFTFLILGFTIKSTFWAGMIAFFVGFCLVIIYNFLSKNDN